MFSRLCSSHFMFIAIVGATVGASFYTTTVEARPRVIVVPGKIAILLLEGVSSVGQDPDPLRLYNSIAMPAIHDPNGDAKVMSTDQKEFTLTCALKTTPVNNVVCNINVKPSAKSQLDFQHVEFHTGGADARRLNEKLAGPDGTYEFETTDKSLAIKSTAERFDFIYR